MARDGADAMLLLWRAVRSDLPPEALGPFRSSGRLAVPDAIAVYKNAYWIRQHECLRELFPRVRARLGEPRFRELVRRYLHAHPSCHPELEWLGAALPGFLAEQAEDDLAGVASIAAYDQALTESFLAADAPSARITDICPASFGASRLRFAPSLRIVAADLALLRTLADEGLEAVGARAVVVARPRYVTTTHLVSREELDLLTHARDGAPIDDLVEHHAHDVTGLHVLLDRWFRRHWIAAIETD